MRITTNPGLVADTVLDALRGIEDLTVYDGWVPDRVPTDAHGYVRPYVALYAGNATGTDDGGLCGLADVDAVDVRLQTTVVAASAAHLRPVTHAVTRALTNLRIGTNVLHPDVEQHRSTVPQPDPSVSPARVFLPLQWHITTQ